jgi:AAA+ ATPase superfamily predicted ATPase
MNPFTNRGVITNEADFIGREEQLGEIIERLRMLQSSSVVGERRIGKSSLLYHLAQTGARRIEDGRYRFFYLDLQDARFHTAAGFFRATLKALGVAPDTINGAIKDEQSLNRNLIAFTDQLEALQQRGECIVLCLDEFEITFKHRDQFPEDFFDHMRSLLNIRKLAIVAASRKTRQTHSLEGKLTSPFYNLFTVAAWALVEGTAKEYGNFPSVNSIRSNSGKQRNGSA